jgi:hypothetical protein
MSEWLDRNGWGELAALGVVGLLATIVRLASDPPRSIARMAWLTVAGLGLCTGGWLVAKGAGLDGYAAMAIAWVVGAMGSEATLPLARRWLEGRLGVPPQPPAPPPSRDA